MPELVTCETLLLDGFDESLGRGNEGVRWATLEDPAPNFGELYKCTRNKIHSLSKIISPYYPPKFVLEFGLQPSISIPVKIQPQTTKTV